MRKISVIIPAFNHAEYIGEALTSVINSDYQNIEVIVVDDGSKDHTREVVSSFRNVHYYYQHNQGAHNALNFGISQASGDYVAILNDDDVFDVNHLTNAIKNISFYGNRIYIGKPRVFGDGWKLEVLNGHIAESHRVIERMGLGKSLFKLNWSTSTSSFVFERDLFSELGGFQGFSMCHDLDFLVRALLLRHVNIGVSDQPTWSYRCHEKNSGSSISSKKQNGEIIYSLGRVLDPIIEDRSIEAIAGFIGYGIAHELKIRALQERPWREENLIGVNECILKWIEKTE